MKALIDPFPGRNAVYPAPGVTPDPAWETERPVCSVCLGAHRREAFYVTDTDELVGRSCLPSVGAVYQIREEQEHRLPRAPQRFPFDPPDHIREWIAGLSYAEEDAITDYEAAFVILTVHGFYRPEQAAIAESVEKAYERAAGRKKAAEDEAARREAETTGEWYGTVGEVQDLGLLRCEAVESLGESADHPEWGERFLIRFTEPISGAVLVWFTGTGGKFDPKPGETYNVRATVKDHTVYGGVRQTVISRAKEKTVAAPTDKPAPRRRRARPAPDAAGVRERGDADPPVAGR